MWQCGMVGMVGGAMQPASARKLCVVLVCACIWLLIIFNDVCVAYIAVFPILLII